ncbi:MAG: hypothetical protein WB420_00710, partial [Bradyrhizobium sp.]
AGLFGCMMPGQQGGTATRPCQEAAGFHHAKLIPHRATGMQLVCGGSTAPIDKHGFPLLEWPER